MNEGIFVDLKDAVITVSDGSATPKTARLRIGDGGFTFKQGSEREYKLDAGKLWRVREGNEVPVEVTLDFVWLHMHTTDVSFSDIILGKNGCVSTDTVYPCDPYACDIDIDFTKACGNVTYFDNYKIANFRVEPQDYDPKESMVKVSGKANSVEVPHSQSSSSDSSSSSSSTT